MYIIVIGGGKVGFFLAKALLDEGHEVIILEKDHHRIEFIANQLGSVGIRGDGCEASTLSEVGTGRADMFIAVTGDDEDNMVSCQVAKHQFDVPVTVARVNDPSNEPIFKELGIDVSISSTKEILEHIEHKVPTHPLTHLLTLKEHELEIVEVKIPATSTTVGKAIKDLSLPDGTILALVINQKGKPQLPTRRTIIRAEDQIIAVTPPEQEDALRTILRGS
ncbi:MAG: TrkA family potassium uptake protein [Dehalococcoidales bacterium]|jgi:trk system potassium uptake protein TrkA